MVFFQRVKFGQHRSIDGRDIGGQTKLEFPGPEYRNPIRVPTPVTGPPKHYRQSCIIKLFHTRRAQSRCGARARRCEVCGAREIFGAACNALAEKAINRSAEARSAEALRKG